MNVSELKDLADIDAMYELNPAKRYVIRFKHDLTQKQHERVMEMLKEQLAGYDIVVVGHQIRLYERED